MDPLNFNLKEVISITTLGSGALKIPRRSLNFWMHKSAKEARLAYLEYRVQATLHAILAETRDDFLLRNI
jgi:hypothetical protein